MNSLGYVIFDNFETNLKKYLQRLIRINIQTGIITENTKLVDGLGTGQCGLS